VLWGPVTDFRFALALPLTEDAIYKSGHAQNHFKSALKTERNKYARASAIHQDLRREVTSGNRFSATEVKEFKI